VSGPTDEFENIYELYYKKIKRFLSLKVDIQTAEDISQLTFIKAMENLHVFRGESTLFTWLSNIAGNLLKNEYRKRHRSLETTVDLLEKTRRFITVEFTANVELRLDVTQALSKLKQIDREILSLHYDVGCTFKEISEMAGMRVSAVKNRLYRALTKLRKELNDWEVQGIMSIIDRISIVNKDSASAATATMDGKVHQDLFDQLKAHVDRISSQLKHHPTKKLTIQIYSDLDSFHRAVNEPNAPSWFMGMIENNTIKIASPLNPGPDHTYQSILKSTVHLFTNWLVKDINPSVPKWLYQGLGGYEAGLMTKEYVHNSVRELVNKGKIPSFLELETDSWDFDKRKGFQFSYLLCEYILETYGQDILNKMIRTPGNFESIISCSLEDSHDQWIRHLRSQFKM
jgi:RNA polymerase sigma-70 factor (ECF subfamily)